MSPRQKQSTNDGATTDQIMAAVESIRAELAVIGDRITSTDESVRAIDDRVASLESVTVARQRKLMTVIKDQTREVEALLQLYAKVDPQAPMPPSGKWALNPQGLLSLFTLIRRNRPRVVVELGSGTSTVWLGYALAASAAGDATEPGRLISLDHEEAFAEQSQESARLHADHMAPTEVRFAPLRTVGLGDEKYVWYDPTALDDAVGIDLLIVDGPPKATGPLARYPAVPLLLDRLSNGALIVLDDATRDDEKKIMERWLRETPGLQREWNSIARQSVFRYAPTLRETAPEANQGGE